MTKPAWILQVLSLKYTVFRVVLSTSRKQPRMEAIVYPLDVSWKTLIKNLKDLVVGFC